MFNILTANNFPNTFINTLSFLRKYITNPMRFQYLQIHDPKTAQKETCTMNSHVCIQTMFVIA